MSLRNMMTKAGEVDFYLHKRDTTGALQVPGSMVTDNRIFSHKFAVYGLLRADTARKRAVFRRNPGYRNTAPYTTPYLCRIRSYACRILITNGRKTPIWIMVKYGA